MVGRIPDQDIARVREATDLVSLVSERVVLKPKGRLWWGCCPFHGEKTPSFKIDPATQLWHCFGCGLGGDAFGFQMRIDNVDFGDAVRLLADRAHIEIHEESGGAPRGHKERLYAALAAASEYYHRVLTGSRDRGPTAARDYLANRGFGSAVAKRWNLGFAPGRGALVRHLTEHGFTHEELVSANLAIRGDDGRLKDRFYERVMFPITDLQGRTVGFGGRVVSKGEPKYLNTNDTPVFSKSANLYGISAAKGSITATGTAVVVEGYTDVIALHEAGVTSAVATLGTALTRQHVKLLGRFAKRVVYLFDGDEAGLRAADRAVEFVDASATPEAGLSRVSLDVSVIPGGLDPADYVAENSGEALRALIETAVPLLRFAIDRRLARWDLDRPEERVRALRDAAEVLAPVRGSVLAGDYAGYIADRLFVKVEQVLAVIPSRFATTERSAVPADSQPAPEEPVSLDPSQRVELDLVALLVREPRLRSRARELLDLSLVGDPRFRSILELLAEQPLGIDPSQLAGLLEQKIPGSASLLASVDPLEDSGARADILSEELIERLQEFGLERRIAVGKSRLKRPEGLSEQESDELFRSIAQLERELSQIRRRTSGA